MNAAMDGSDGHESDVNFHGYLFRFVTKLEFNASNALEFDREVGWLFHNT